MITGIIDVFILDDDSSLGREMASKSPILGKHMDESVPVLVPICIARIANLRQGIGRIVHCVMQLARRTQVTRGASEYGYQILELMEGRMACCTSVAVEGISETMEVATQQKQTEPLGYTSPGRHL